MSAQIILFFWDVYEGEFRFVDMSHTGLAGPKNRLWSVAVTSIDVICESWSSLGSFLASVVLGWVKRALKPYREMSSPTQPIQVSSL